MTVNAGANGAIEARRRIDRRLGPEVVGRFYEVAGGADLFDGVLSAVEVLPEMTGVSVLIYAPARSASAGCGWGGDGLSYAGAGAKP